MGKTKGFDGLAGLRTDVRDATAPVAQHAELEAAIAERPDDANAYLVYGDALERAGDPRGPWIALCARGDEAMRRAYLAEHELYLLGGVAPWLRDGTIQLVWEHGFVRSLRIGQRRGGDPTRHVLDAIAAFVDVPSCRFLRELWIGGAKVDPRKVVARLVELARPATLTTIRFDVPGWTPTSKLRQRFPRLAEGDAVLEATLAGARAIPLAADLAWDKLPRLAEHQALARLSAIHERLVAPDPRTGLAVDPEVLVHAGIHACGGGRTGSLVLPRLPGGLFVEGDVRIDGVVEQPFRSSPAIVFGNLAAETLCLDGHLVVTGDLEADLVYGCCSNYATVVLGRARVGTALLERGHVLVVHGERAIRSELDDEVDRGSVQAHLAAFAMPADGGASALAAHLRQRR